MIWALALLLFAMKKKSSVGAVTTNTEFAGLLYSWLDEKEGGLSNTGEAGDARLKRAPCDVIGPNGQYMNPRPHTSAGVTWTTYETVGPSLGIQVSCEDWAQMSKPEKNESWFKFVDYYRGKGLKYSSNQVISSYMGLWYWGGWDPKLMPTKNVLAVTQSMLSNELKLKRLVELRKQYFRALKLKRGYSDNWLSAVERRANSFLENFQKYV